MPADLNPSTKPQLSARPSVTFLETVLRVDQIRTDTLTQLVQQWADPDSRDDVIAQLDALAEALAGTCGEGEVDALVEQVENAAGMDDAEVRMSRMDARRLRNELDAAVRRSPVGLSVQRDRGAA